MNYGEKKIDRKRRTDGSKLLWHTGRIDERFLEGKRVPPLHLDWSLSKFCNIACVFCVAGFTKILMADFTFKNIQDIVIGDMVMGFDEFKPEEQNSAQYYPTKVTNTFKNKARTHTIQKKDGSNRLRITLDHSVLMEGHRWRPLKKISDGRIRYFCDPYDTDTEENAMYKLGYLKGLLEGDGTFGTYTDTRPEQNNYEFVKFKLNLIDMEPLAQCKKYVKDLFNIDLKQTDRQIVRSDSKREVELMRKAIKWKVYTNFSEYPKDYIRGYLGGVFDAEGSMSVSLRIANKLDDIVFDHIKQCLTLEKYDWVEERHSVTNILSGARIRGGYAEHSRFFGQNKPVIARKLEALYHGEIPSTADILKTDSGVTEDTYNLETESHTYVANGYCVHNCYGKFQNIQPVFIQREPLLKSIKDAAEIGVKSVAFIGDGEPSCNPYFYEALKLGKSLGIDMATSTNGVLVNTDEKMLDILNSCVWMRFCISAGTREGYKKIHGVDKFDTVVANIKRMVELRDKYNIKIDIGMQSVFVPTIMIDEMVEESKLAVQLGVDYFTIKQCSLPDDGGSGMLQFDPAYYDKPEVLEALQKCEDMSNERTQIIPKWNVMKLKGQKPYKHCASISLISEISGDGSWLPCGYMFGGKEQFEKYKFGNIHEKSLKEIWESDRYWDIIKHMETEFDVHKDCKGCCRQDPCNIFLDEYLTRPSGINFI